MEKMLVLDGCAFTEGQFKGVAPYVHQSPLTGFFLTLPGDGKGFHECVHRVGEIYDLADDPEQRLLVAKSADDIRRAAREGKKAVIFALQDPHAMENSLAKLRVLYELGLRVMQMTYNKANYLGSGCLEPQDHGLTEFGRAALKRMNQLGIVADASHCGHQTTQDIIRYSEKPVVISHAGALALTENPRNKNDRELKMLKENNGVIGLSPWGPLCWRPAECKRPSLADFVDHIDYVADLIGADHIGFGGDSTLDGSQDKAGTAVQSTLYGAVVADYNRCVGIDPDERHAIGVAGSWEIGNVFAELRRRHYSEQDIAKFAGGNFLRVVEQNCK